MSESEKEESSLRAVKDQALEQVDEARFLAERTVARRAKEARALVERDNARRERNRTYQKNRRAEVAEARALLGLPALRRGPRKELLPEDGGVK